MSQRSRRLPSPALAISLVALILAVGGGTFALAGGDGARDRKIAKRVANRQIIKRAPGLSVDHAATADQATNADQLGGIPASGFARNGCDSSTGQIRGFARINAANVDPTTFSTAGVETPYNCSGQDVEARHALGTGTYEVRFDGSPATAALATPMEANGAQGWDVNTASVNRKAPGDFYVQLYNTPTDSFIDDSFVILAP